MEPEKVKILIVDDEPDILEFISYNLQKQGWEVFQAQNGKEALELARKEIPQLIILDVMMPEMDGIETCHEIRNLPDLEHVLIVFLTARNEDAIQIAGFESGGDDYITKPVKPQILISRVKALLRRQKKHKPSDNILEAGELQIDKDKYHVIFRNEKVILPKKEFELLCLLASKAGKVFKRHEILNKIWGQEVIVGDRTIDVHIRKLREKFGEEVIKTIKGVGYKINQ